MKPYCTISAVIFGVIAALHCVRALQGWTFVIGPFDVPIWLSGVGAVVAAALSATGLRLSRR